MKAAAFQRCAGSVLPPPVERPGAGRGGEGISLEEASGQRSREPRLASAVRSIARPVRQALTGDGHGSTVDVHAQQATLRHPESRSTTRIGTALALGAQQGRGQALAGPEQKSALTACWIDDPQAKERR